MCVAAFISEQLGYNALKFDISYWKMDNDLEANFGIAWLCHAEIIQFYWLKISTCQPTIVS